MIFHVHRELLIEPPRPRYEGRITWELGRFTDGANHVRSRGEVKNLIVDTGLDFLATGTISGATNFVSVGTGSTAPATAQTAMVAEVARTNRRTTNDFTIASGAAFAYWSVKWVYLFIEAEANGNLTEVGFFNQTSGGVMFARQLFKDITGTPTTVVKTINDQLKITYEIRLYPPTVDTNQSGLVISGTSYSVQTRAREIDNDIIWGYNVGAGAGFLIKAGSLFGAPGGRAFDGAATLGTTSGSIAAGASAQADTSVAAGYASGSFYRDITMKWEPPNANYGSGIGGFHTHGGGTTELFQSVFTPAFTKDATKRLTLIVRCAWARYP